MSLNNQTRLALWLIRLDKPQSWLADQLGVTVTAVQHWISGRRPVPLRHRPALRALIPGHSVLREPAKVGALPLWDWLSY